MIYFFRNGYVYGVPTDGIEREHPELEGYELSILDEYDRQDPHYADPIGEVCGSNRRMGTTFYQKVDSDQILDMDPKAFILVKSWLDVEEWEGRDDPDVLDYCRKVREALKSEEGEQ